MRKAALLLVAVTALGARPPSRMRGGTPRRRRVIASGRSQRLRLAARSPSGAPARRHAGSRSPTDAISRLPFPSDILSGQWLANRRGDVLLVDHVGSNGALLVEAAALRCG